MGAITIADRYFIHDSDQACIGRGGMGNVYLAQDKESNTAVAVKHLKSELVARDPDVLERFAREAEALRRLNHPNIVVVFDTLAVDDEHYIIMEYVPGGSLHDLLSDQGPLSVQRVLQIGLGLADALTRAHHLSVVHRDIKPANVLLAADGTPRLTDFGVAYLEDMMSITKTGSLTGTYAYLSPEACDGVTLDARTDIWSFGVMLYEMLTNKRPFEGQHVAATLTAIMVKPVPDITQFRPDVPEALANLLYQMLEKDRHRRISSVRMVGARLEAILLGAGTLSESDRSRFDTNTPSPPVIPVMGPRHNLPPQPTPFVGRETEIDELAALLDEVDCRLLTLVGPGGIGKTRLSIEVANRKVDLFRHGVRFISLAPVQTPTFMITAVADALTLSLFGESDSREQLLSFLREKEMLLVMDNFEHLLDGVDLVSDILAQAPHVKILATSREPLRLWEEWSRSVAGMSYPEDGQDKDVDSYSAVQLFTDRARRVRGRLNWQDELPHIIRICQLVEGLPLGIELAATWLNVLSPSEIVTEITDSIDFLATSMRNIAPRHRSIRAVFDYSWQLLSESEQLVFCKLSVFQGGFQRDAARYVAGASLRVLNSLVSKSLLQDSATAVVPAVTAERHRYRMHELVKQYAAIRLEEWGQMVETCRIHSDYYTQLVADLEPDLKTSAQKRAQDKITAEMENIRSAWQWAVDNLAHRPLAISYLARVLEGLHIFHINRGLIVENGELFERALTALEAPEVARQYDALTYNYLLGRVMMHRGRYFISLFQPELGYNLFPSSIELLEATREQLSPTDPRWLDVERDLILAKLFTSFRVAAIESRPKALQTLQEAAERCQRIEDVWLFARVMNAQALLTDSVPERIELYQQSLALSRQEGDSIGVIRTLINLSLDIDDPHEANELLYQGLTIARRLQNPGAVALLYSRLSLRAFYAGDYATAIAYGEKSIAMYEEMGISSYLRMLLLGLSWADWAMGNTVKARQRLARVVTLAREDGDVLATINALFQLGKVVLEVSSFAEAKQLYKEAMALLTQISEPNVRSEALDRLGNFAIALGFYGQAKQHFEMNMPLFKAAGNLSGEAWALCNLGNVAYESGDYVTAKAQYEASLAVHRQINQASFIVPVLNNIGRVAYAMGNSYEARHYYREALTLAKGYWAVVPSLEILIDWVSLLIQDGEREKGLKYLYTVCQHYMFVPPLLNKRARDKCHRLIAELSANFNQQTVSDVKAQAGELTYQMLVDEIVS